MRLLLVEDHQMMRQGLCALLREQGDMEVVGEAEDQESAIELARDLRPDLVIMDVGLGEHTGDEVTQRLRAEVPSAQIVALSMYTDERFVTGMIEAGARGYVVKGSPVEELVRALRIVADGGSYLSAEVAHVLVESYVRDKSSSGPVDQSALTTRERDVLRLLADGKSTKEIAFDMGLSTKTVDTHRRHLMAKVGIDSVAGLTKYAVQAGISDPEP